MTVASPNTIGISGGVSPPTSSATQDVVTLLNLPAETWTPVNSAVVPVVGSFQVFQGGSDITSQIATRIVSGVLELRSSLAIANVSVELEA